MNSGHIDINFVDNRSPSTRKITMKEFMQAVKSVNAQNNFQKCNEYIQKLSSFGMPKISKCCDIGDIELQNVLNFNSVSYASAKYANMFVQKNHKIIAI